jgi:Antitoxin SocA-like, Panacea domain
VTPTIVLYKILWLADLEHYRRTGRSLTGATAYTKHRFGPVPKDVMPTFELIVGNEIATIDMIADAKLANDALWVETEIGADMPIGAASIVGGKITPADIDWATTVFAANP